MARFFQHIMPGDNLGKVVQLSYIDDILDDEFVFFVFNDGTKCNKEFIASPDNKDAFNGKFVMAELYSPNAQWKIETHEVHIGETKTYTDPESGVVYEIPAPGIQQNGEYGGGSGSEMARAKDGSIRTTAVPPVWHGKTTVESDDNFLLSTHPELHLDNIEKTKEEIISIPEKVITDPVKSVYPKTETDIINDVSKVINETESSEGLLIGPADPTQWVTRVPDELVNVDSLISCAKLYIDLNDKDNNYVKKIELNYNGNSYYYEDIIKLLESLSNPVVTTDKDTQNIDAVKFIQDYLDSEDSLITNMIEKSKKVESEVGMDLTLSLPPKEVYNTIKNVYPEEMCENFIKSLAYRISIKCLVDAIASGLSVYYDGEKMAADDSVQ